MRVKRGAFLVLRRDVILFDLDGTVMDTYEAIMASMRYATKAVLGESFSDEELAAGVGTPLIDQMRVFAKGDEDVAQKLLVTYRSHNEEDLNSNIAPFEGIPEAFVALREAGYSIGVVTSKRRELAATSLDHFGLLDGLVCMNGLEDSAGHKPDPDPLLQAAKDINVPIERCIYVGDSPFDIQAANAANIPSIAVTWGKFFAEQDLAPENPTLIIHHTNELLPAVAAIV